MANLANVIEQLRQNQIAGDEQSEATSGALQANTAALTAMGNTLTEIHSSISMLGIAVNSIASVITAQEDDGDDKATQQRKEQKDKEDKEEQQNLLKRMMSGFTRTMSSIKESITKVMPKTMGSALTGILGGLLLPLLSPAAGPAALAAGLATGNPALILAGAIATIITAVANSDEIKAAFEAFKQNVMDALAKALQVVKDEFIRGWEWLKTFYQENLAPYIDPYREGFMAIFGPIIDFFKENPDKLWYVGIAAALSTLLGSGGIGALGAAIIKMASLLAANPIIAAILGLTVAGAALYTAVTDVLDNREQRQQEQVQEAIDRGFVDEEAARQAAIDSFGSRQATEEQIQERMESQVQRQYGDLAGIPQEVIDALGGPAAFADNATALSALFNTSLAEEFQQGKRALERRRENIEYSLEMADRRIAVAQRNGMAEDSERMLELQAQRADIVTALDVQNQAINNYASTFVAQNINEVDGSYSSPSEGP